MARQKIEFDEELTTAICDLIATSEIGLDDVLRELAPSGTPSLSTIYRWLEEHEAFQALYARARLLQADLLADLAVKESFTSRMGVVRKDSTKDGVTETISDNVERSKLIVQTILKRAGQLAPKKYGEKVAHTGEDGGAIQFVVTRAGKKEN